MLLEINILPDDNLLVHEAIIVSTVTGYTETEYQKDWELKPPVSKISFLEEGEQITELSLYYLKTSKRFGLCFEIVDEDGEPCGCELEVKSVREIKDFPSLND